MEYEETELNIKESKSEDPNNPEIKINQVVEIENLFD